MLNLLDEKNRERFARRRADRAGLPARRDGRAAHRDPGRQLLALRRGAGHGPRRLLRRGRLRLHARPPGPEDRRPPRTVQRPVHSIPLPLVRHGGPPPSAARSSSSPTRSRPYGARSSRGPRRSGSWCRPTRSATGSCRASWGASTTFARTATFRCPSRTARARSTPRSTSSGWRPSACGCTTAQPSSMSSWTSAPPCSSTG